MTPRLVAAGRRAGGMKLLEKRVRVHTIRRPVFERGINPFALEPESSSEGISLARGPIEKNTDATDESPGASASTSDQPDTAGRARILLHIRAPARKEAGCAEAG